MTAAFDAIKPLHKIFDHHQHAVKGSSLSSCILCADIASTAFTEMGLRAKAVPSGLLSVTRSPSGQIVTHKIGSVDGHDLTAKDGARRDGWNGHMVVIVEDYLFDPTFWQINPAIEFPIMIAAPIERKRVLGDTFDSLALTRTIVANQACEIVWIDTPLNDAHQRYRGSNRAIKKRLDVIRRDVATALSKAARSA